MRSFLGILSFICFFSCKVDNDTNKLTNRYVQANEVQLTNPKVEVDNTVIDTFSTVTASFHLQGASIHYTNDGSDPSLTSQEYTGPISVSKPGSYKFKAFHPDFIPSETALVKLYKKGLEVHDISLVSALSEQYPGQGKNTLINHKKGTLNFRDGQWIGVTEPFIAIVDFGNTVFLESLDIGYLVNTGAWIFPIQDVSMEVSEDGANFTKIEMPQIKKEPDNDITKQDHLHIPISKELKKIRIEVSNIASIPEWHQGSGNAAWLFMDEWIFNTQNN